MYPNSITVKSLSAGLPSHCRCPATACSTHPRCRTHLPPLNTTASAASESAPRSTRPWLLSASPAPSARGQQHRLRSQTNFSARRRRIECPDHLYKPRSPSSELLSGSSSWSWKSASNASLEDSPPFVTAVSARAFERHPEVRGGLGNAPMIPNNRWNWSPSESSCAITSFSAMGVHVSLERVASAKRRRIRKRVGQVKQAFTSTSHDSPTDDGELAKTGDESVARFSCWQEEGGHGRLEIRGRGQDREVQEDVANLRDGVNVY